MTDTHSCPTTEVSGLRMQVNNLLAEREALASQVRRLTNTILDGHPNHPAAPGSRQLDLTPIRAWIVPCGHCDSGMPAECTHPAGDYRTPMAALLIEVEQLRAALHQARTNGQAAALERVAQIIVGVGAGDVDDTERLTFGKIRAALRPINGQAAS